MNFLFTLFSSVTSSYASIDLGSQYIRISLSSISSDVQMALNHQQKILTPCAVAFKHQNNTSRHFTNEEGFKAFLKIGDDALKYLKYQPKSGTDRLNYFIGRYKFTADQHQIPQIANTTEMLSLILTKLFMNQQYAGLEGISLTVPRYYTLSQRECFTQAMYLARLPYLGTYDDDDSIIQFYTVKFSKKILKRKINVLFVDIGASGIRAYRVEFSINKRSTPFANQTSYVWSEKTGGFAFNSQISKNKKITEAKAQKLLINGKVDLTTLLKKELLEITNVVKKAAHGELSVDEIQIFGTCSRYSFVKKAVQSAFPSVEVLRDLPSSEANALGSLYFLNCLLNLSRYKLVEVVKAPIYTITAECGGVIEDYCVNENNKINCSMYIILHSTICDQIVFAAEEDEVPIGCGNIIGQYSLKNISKFKYDLTDELNGIIVMNPPSASIFEATWCAMTTQNQINEFQYIQSENDMNDDEERCEKVDVEISPLTDLTNKAKYDFIQSVLKGEDDRKLIADLKAKLERYSRMIRVTQKDVRMETKMETKMESVIELAERADAYVVNAEGDDKIEMRNLIKKIEDHFKLLGIKYK